MVPVHDTDLAGKHWREGEWEGYEFWEQIEARLRKRRMLWIAATTVVFLALAAVPVWRDQAPKWEAQRRTRLLAELVNELRTGASVSHEAWKLTFPKAGSGHFDYVLSRAPQCASHDWKVEREGLLSTPGEGIALLTPDQGRRLGIPSVITEFCYQPTGIPWGNAAEAKDGPLPLAWAFAVIPVKDLTDSRADRVSVLLIRGAAAELAFE